MTLVHKLLGHIEKRPLKPAVRYFKNDHLYTLNWQQTFDHIEQIYQGLLGLDLKKGDRVCIYSDTCKDWGFLDLALMAVGAVSVPIYHSSPMDDVDFIIKETEPEFIFIQNEMLYNKIKSLSVLNHSQKLILMESFANNDERCSSIQEILTDKRKSSPLQDCLDAINDDDLVTLIYTSGTSGRPKGVCITHKQVMSSVSEVYPLLGITDEDSTLTFLPFSHVLGRIELWGHYFCGYCIGYAQSIERIKRNLLVVQPTVIVGVPRIFEKMYFGILAQVEISKLKRFIFNKALEIGESVINFRAQKSTPPMTLGLRSLLAHNLVFKNIQQKLGGRLRFAVSGGAPLDPQISHFFEKCGVSILEGYGLTETTGPIFVNTLFEMKSGTVGQAIGDVKVKFAEDGEILIKSDKVMKSYYLNDEATREVFDEEGYFKTGDIGELDSNGYLKITDRKKDLIKTAGGKFVAPQKIQNLFATQPLISHVHVHGDKKKFIVALLTLDEQEVLKFKEAHQLSASTFALMLESKKLNEEVRRVVAEINKNLASFETIKNFKILDKDFTIEGGELTPSLKMKRKVIDQKFQGLIDELYS